MKSLDLDPIAFAQLATRRLALPTGVPSFVLPSGQRTPTDLAALLVRATDVEGVVGWSLLWGQAPHQLDLLEACVHQVARFVDPGHPMSIADLIAAVGSGCAFFAPAGVLRFGLSALEMATVDLGLRRRGQSLSDAVGRRHSRVRVYETGLMMFRSSEELVDEAQRLVDGGHRAMKMIVGGDVGTDVERIAAVRSAIPDSSHLMVDVLQRWDVDAALRGVDAFRDFDLGWIEDPLNHADVAGYRQVAQRSTVPIATGENHYELERFDALAGAGVGFVVTELERTGGFSGWLSVAQQLQGTSTEMLPHLYPQVSTQLVSTLDQDTVWVEHVPWFDDLVGGPMAVDDGWLQVPTDPGSGFAPDMDAVERLATSPWVNVPLGAAQA